MTSGAPAWTVCSHYSTQMTARKPVLREGTGQQTRRCAMPERLAPARTIDFKRKFPRTRLRYTASAHAADLRETRGAPDLYEGSLSMISRPG